MYFIRSFPLRPLFAACLLCMGMQPCILAHSAAHATVDADPVAPPLPYPQIYSEKIDPAGYLVSEKLDGVRAYWDGSNLRFRRGRLIHAPAWFTAGFPSHPLDGELWMGRRSFDDLSAAVRRDMPVDAEWKRITYRLYELPGADGSFSQRLIALQALVASANVVWLQAVPQTIIKDKEELKRRLQEVVRGGGEGLVLHLADAPWQSGRTDALLKLKPVQDAEAVVVAHEPGRGKYQGMLGALVVMTPDGRRFRLGTGFSDEARNHPPPVGSTVTYRYRDLTSTGLPKFASFWRVREVE